MEANLVFGWLWVLGGIVAGAAIGLFFHREDWAGGYGSFRRRMIRLGHISFVGLGLLNMLFALTSGPLGVGVPYDAVASALFIAGAATMPTCCYLAAWRKGFRHLFPIPVVCTLAAVILMLVGGVLL